jgi:hypothetical protein
MTILRAALLKLGRRPATRITFLILVALLLVIYISLAASMEMIEAEGETGALAEIFAYPGAYGQLGSMLMTFSALAAAAYAGTIAGSEWSWGAFRVAIARGESRIRYVLVTFVAVALVALIGFVVLFAFGSLLSYVIGGLMGLAPGDPFADGILATIPAIVFGGWWVVVMSAAIAFAVGFATRSAVMGIVAIVAIYFGEQMAAIIVPADVLRYLPIGAGTELVRAAASPATLGDIGLPLVAVTAYLAAALTGVALVAARTEAA